MSIKQVRRGTTMVTTTAALAYGQEKRRYKNLMERGLSAIFGTKDTKVVMPTSNPEYTLHMVGDKDLMTVAYSSATPKWLYKVAKQEMMRRGSTGWMNKPADMDTYPLAVLEVLTTPATVEVVR